MSATGSPPNSSCMLVHGHPVPSLKRQLRSTANAAREQRKRHAGGLKLLTAANQSLRAQHMPAVSYCFVYRFQTHVSIT